ncbi:DNA ligase [Paenibacillus tarimensis]
MPEEPMGPVSSAGLPSGPEWGFQIKWDGVRILALIRRSGEVEIYSRRMQLKNRIYPEITRLLASKAAELGDCLLDGEVVYWDGVRPSFQKVLQRERQRGNVSAPGTTTPQGMLMYVLFDLLFDNGTDLRPLPFEQRHERLNRKFPVKEDRFFVTDLFSDGEALWKWVSEHQWEGVVSKRLSSPYREGKKHNDWLKTKTALHLTADIVGIKLREGRVASLVMSCDGVFIGSVSLGLDEAMKSLIFQNTVSQGAVDSRCPFPHLPAELKGERVVWLADPFKCRVTGLEMTSAGLLRHPKITGFGHRD